MARTISTPRKIPPIVLVSPKIGKSSKQKKRKQAKTSRSISKTSDDEIAIVKIVPPPTPPSDDDVELVYEKACVPRANEVNRGSSAEETIDFLESVCQCRSHTATPSEDVAGGGLAVNDDNIEDILGSARRANANEINRRSSADEMGGFFDAVRQRYMAMVTVTPSEDVEGVGLAVNEDNISEDEDENSQDIYNGTAARTRPAVLKRRRPRQGQHRTSENGKEAESPAESPHDLDDMQHQHAKAKKGKGGQLEPGQKECMEGATKRKSVPPSGGEDVVVGPLTPAKKGTKRKLQIPSKRKTTGRGRKGMKKAPKRISFSCYFCQKTTKTNQTLERHLLTHTKEAPFKCHICRKEFNQKSHLNEHIRRHLKEKPFKCSHPGCSSSFVTGSLLKEHSRVHSGEKPYSCPHPGCGKTFPRNSSLKIHSRTHSGEKPYVCSFPGCGKAFKQRSSLIDHRMVHVQNGTVNTHVRSHLKEKNFKCPHTGCSSSFVTGGDLKKHSVVHCAEKPFACPHPGCGKVFSQNGNLIRHSRVHSGEKPYSCPFPGCGKSFSDQSCFSRHRKIHARAAAL